MYIPLPETYAEAIPKTILYVGSIRLVRVCLEVWTEEVHSHR